MMPLALRGGWCHHFQQAAPCYYTILPVLSSLYLILKSLKSFQTATIALFLIFSRADVANKSRRTIQLTPPHPLRTSIIQNSRLSKQRIPQPLQPHMQPRIQQELLPSPFEWVLPLLLGFLCLLHLVQPIHIPLLLKNAMVHDGMQKMPSSYNLSNRQSRNLLFLRIIQLRMSPLCFHGNPFVNAGKIKSRSASSREASSLGETT
jgi:hypothetical protein